MRPLLTGRLTPGRVEKRIMKKSALRRLLLFLTIIALLAPSGATRADAAEIKARQKVLILNSYHSGYRGSDDIVKGFRETLLKALPQTEILIEYLDSKNYSGSAFDAKIIDLLTFKYQKRHFDLIFSTDDYAFDVLEKQRENIFGSTPVVFCGTNSFDPSRLKGKHGIVGIDERPSFKDTLDLIFKLHPKATEVIAISDQSVTGRLNEEEFRKAAAQLSTRARFSYVAGLRLDLLLERVKKVRPDSVIVYFASFVEDKNGERVSTNDALKLVSAASPVPVYGGWEFSLGNGIVGGRLINLREHGSAAATMAANILKGAAIDTMPTVLPSPNKEMFDYNEMRRFRIPESRLPKGSILINKPPNLLWSHRVEILATISIILLFALIDNLFKLVHSRRTIKRHRDDLIERNAELEEALSKIKMLEGIIPVCMYCKKVQNDEQSWQQMESYISQHSEAQFSHGICPACFEEKFGEAPVKKA